MRPTFGDVVAAVLWLAMLVLAGWFILWSMGVA